MVSKEVNKKKVLYFNTHSYNEKGKIEKSKKENPLFGSLPFLLFITQKG